MPRLWWIAIMVCALSPSLVAQPVLLDAPLVLHAPGYRGIWPAWYDGEVFWTEPRALMELLGYEVHASDTTELAVRDRRHAIRFGFTEEMIEVNHAVKYTGSFAMVGPAGVMLITLDALQETLGADAVWDKSTLTLTLSSSAELFDPTRFGGRRTLGIEPTDNIQFPRERHWIGGVHVGYALAHQWHQKRGRSISPTARVTAAVAGGTIRWFLTRSSSQLRYEFDLQRAWLTRIEASYHPGGAAPGLQLSNRPLHPRKVQREEVLTGVTIPHAIVRGKVFGAITEQVQADRHGRYTLRRPVFYGSTEASVEVEPLGGNPVDILEVRHLTPQDLLPSGRFEYDIHVSPTPDVQVAWGVFDALTLRASAALRPRSTRISATVIPLPTASLSVSADALRRSGWASLRWWRPWGGVTGDYRRQEFPFRRQHWSSTLTLAGDARSLYTRVLHEQARQAPPLTTVTATLGWQVTPAFVLRSGVRYRSPTPKTPSVHPTASYTLPIARPRTVVRLRAESAGVRPTAYEAGVSASGRVWSTGLQVRRSVQSGDLEVRAHLQLNTQRAWLDVRAGWDEEGYRHSQTLRGTIMVGEDIRLAALYTERTQAVIRLFTDTNLNGILDGGERLHLHARVDVGHLSVQHRATGEVIAPNLVPHEVYRVQIEPTSIPDPLLHPATGYTFAFHATPGKTRYIDVPLQMLPTIAGQLTGWPGSYSALQVHLQPQSHPNPTTVDVYQDGAFFAQLLPGSYHATIINRLTGEEVAAQALIVAPGANAPVISILP